MSAAARDILRQIEALEPPVRRAFLEIVARVSGDVRISALERLIQQGRYEEILAAIGLDEAQLSVLAEQVRSAYVAGGAAGAAKMARVRFVFDLRNPVAEAWIRENAARLVTSVLSDQVEAIRIIVANGAVLGRNPRQTALDIAGRIDAQTGRRVGGVIGLTSQQAQFVANARTQLLSGDPAQMRAFLTRQLRDRRFDGIVQRAAAAGKPVPTAIVDKITTKYADRLLKLRAETIARTETLAAFNSARDESFRQAIESGKVGADAVQKTWSATGDSRTRDAHRSLNGQNRGMDMPFQSPTGAQLQFPGDTSLGAGAVDIANCRCAAIYRIDFLGEALRDE